MRAVQDILKLIHREGYIFLIIFTAATLLLGSISSSLGWIGVIATVLCAYFFRDPTRITPAATGLVISPADGVIQSIKYTKPPVDNYDEEEMLRISIFLNVLNVHVNRVPADGKIVSLHYNPGKFFNASLDKSSIYNERQTVVMESSTGQPIIFVQIAGLIARRIVCDLEEGSEVKAGTRFGIIRFGSRMDVYLPKNTIPIVAVGQTCVGGETILADFKSKKVVQPQFEMR